MPFHHQSSFSAYRYHKSPAVSVGLGYLILEVLDAVDDALVAELLLVLPAEQDDRFLCFRRQIHLLRHRTFLTEIFYNKKVGMFK